ncbi:hypothetical protein P154DRAFT_586523 [Amniculicola lignicola CBS 123094]|uniref:BTB domain-containing protein n=1 Tax=Amniculicola lignicola CBS 123094 TaxID=1392246 RepID=A0A6A5VXJ5_9PLEO|nr:hypothetical protein P154DRAFT_586523 [Amniculicola lignicola CBS 123094]
MSALNQEEDVEIVLSHDRHYKFHSGVLARNCLFFAELLVEKNAARLCGKARLAGIKIRWMFELTKLPGEGRPAGELKLVPLDPMGRPPLAPGLVVNENGRIPITIFDSYEAILYALYGKDLPISDNDMTSVLRDASEIIDIATYLGCMSLISKPVTVALLKHGQALFRAIQTVPWGWLAMGCRIQSEIIFGEAVAHLAGNWRKIKEDREVMDRIRHVDKDVEGLCTTLHKRIVVETRRFEMLIMTHYPAGMAQPVDQLPIKREEYSRDILVWMALAWFRHWFGQQIISGQGAFSSDGGYKLFSVIAAGGDAYLDKALLNQFHNKFPLTKKALNVTENHLLEIKECMKQLVLNSGLMDSKCQLDVRRYPCDYFTCVKVGRGELPWVKSGEMMEMPVVRSKGRRLGGNEIAARNQAAARKLAEAPSSAGMGRKEGSGSGQRNYQMFVDDGDEEEEEMATPARKRVRRD